MAPKRGTNWLPAHDQLLAQTVLTAVTHGFPQTQAFKTASREIGRSADACKSRWKNYLCDIYETEFDEAIEAGKRAIQERIAGIRQVSMHADQHAMLTEIVEREHRRPSQIVDDAITEYYERHIQN